jgi:hypothetical protein
MRICTLYILISVRRLVFYGVPTILLGPIVTKRVGIFNKLGVGELQPNP